MQDTRLGTPKSKKPYRMSKTGELAVATIVNTKHKYIDLGNYDESYDGDIHFINSHEEQTGIYCKVQVKCGKTYSKGYAMKAIHKQIWTEMYPHRPLIIVLVPSNFEHPVYFRFIPNQTPNVLHPVNGEPFTIDSLEDIRQWCEKLAKIGKIAVEAVQETVPNFTSPSSFFEFENVMKRRIQQTTAPQKLVQNPSPMKRMKSEPQNTKPFLLRLMEEKAQQKCERKAIKVEPVRTKKLSPAVESNKENVSPPSSSSVVVRYHSINSKVYHDDRNCSYLRSATTVRHITGTIDWKTFKPCRSCINISVTMQDLKS